MKGKKEKYLLLTLVFTLIMNIFNPDIVQAASVTSGEIPINIFLDGTPPMDSETYKVIVEATSPEFPLTGADSEGQLEKEIKGEGTTNVPAITFDRIGVYSYKLWQETGKNGLATYDESVYNLVIYVTDEENGLTPTILLYKDGEEKKFDEVDFRNDYESPPTPEPEEPEEEPDKPEEPEEPGEPEEKPEEELPKTGISSTWQYSVFGLLFVGLGYGLNKKRKQYN